MDGLAMRRFLPLFCLVFFLHSESIAFAELTPAKTPDHNADIIDSASTKQDSTTILTGTVVYDGTPRITEFVTQVIKDISFP